jgi:Crp-like helix-turn-helix domain
MIGANREAVTRAFGRLQDEGALQIRRRLIYVDDVEALQRAAGRLLEEEGEGGSLERTSLEHLLRPSPRFLRASRFLTLPRVCPPEHVHIFVSPIYGRRRLRPLILQ